jgi:acetyltransferase-like isoleucine patch superfamily enzyme
MRKLWWALRDEIRAFATAFVLRVPGNTGDKLRARWMRRRLRHLGENVVFRSGVLITMPEKVSIGSNCNFAPNVVITGGGGVTIGNWVGFGPDVKVWSMNHRFDDPDMPWLQQGWDTKSVTIEDDVWLAANVFVMPGVTIGRGAIVSAATVVNKSIPPYAIVVGNPGRVVGWRKPPAGAAGTPSSAVSAAAETAT